MRLGVRALMLGLIALCLAGPQHVGAQAASRYFPETGYTISGRFYEFWLNNGGLAVFGYPLSDQSQENGLQTQYFERQRFELHPENARPYDVLLGRLGAEILGNNGPPVGVGTLPGCVYFEPTQRSVCNQQGNTGFLNYWRSHGLEFDRMAGKSYSESLALFGYPITNEYDYVNSSGETIIAQWFERARFEWYPNNPNPYKVLLGRLGADLRPPTPAPGFVDRVNIYLIAVGGNGPVGCGDQAVPVIRQITPTQAPLQAALTELLNLKSKDYGESGLYNALYQSDLRLDKVVIVDGRATVNLSGQVRLGGVCDTPRVVAQIEQTVRQFPSITSADIFLNGERLADAL